MGTAEPSTTGKGRKRTRNQTVAHPPASQPRERAVPRTYTTVEKITACTAALSVNIDHPYSQDAMKAARESIHSPQLNNQTLYSWMAECRTEIEKHMAAQPTMAQIVQDTQNKVIANMVAVRDATLERMNRPDVLDKAALRDLAVVMGITQDHIHKMHKVSPERMNKVYSIIDACQRVNLDFDVLLDDMLAAVQTQTIAQPKVINAQAENSMDKPTD